ncbi:MAG: hypothetical protein ACRYGR_02380 [Janthinobacterium lividum]
MSDDKAPPDDHWIKPVSFLDLAEAGLDIANGPRRWAERDRQKEITKLLVKAADEKENELIAKRNAYLDARLLEQGKTFIQRRGALVGIVGACVTMFITVWTWVASWPIFHGVLGK